MMVNLVSVCKHFFIFLVIFLAYHSNASKSSLRNKVNTFKRDTNTTAGTDVKVTLADGVKVNSGAGQTVVVNGKEGVAVDSGAGQTVAVDGKDGVTVDSGVGYKIRVSWRNGVSVTGPGIPP